MFAIFTMLSIYDRELSFEGDTIRSNLSDDVLRTFDKDRHGEVTGRSGFLLNKKGEISIDLHKYNPSTCRNIVMYNQLKNNYDGDKSDLSNLDLAGAEMSFSHFAGANLSGSDLTGADLMGSNLAKANLSNANLTGASLVAATLTGANLAGAILTGARLNGADLTGAIMTAAVMYDNRGFNIDGKHRNGTQYDDQGFDINKVHKNGTKYGDDGFDCDGYNKQGYDRSGYDRQGFDANGIDRSGYDKQGFNKQGYDREGYYKDGFNVHGYTRQGYDRSGVKHRIIKTNFPVYSDHNPETDKEIRRGEEINLARYGLPRDKCQGIFFTDGTCLNLVYAADTPSLDVKHGLMGPLEPNYTVVV